MIVIAKLLHLVSTILFLFATIFSFFSGFLAGLPGLSGIVCAAYAYNAGLGITHVIIYFVVATLLMYLTTAIISGIIMLLFYIGGMIEHYSETLVSAIPSRE